jgi:hypothetical protein
MEAIGFILILFGLAIAYWFIRKARLKREEEVRRRRREGLIAKYNSVQIADDIIAHKIWQGMTSDQLVDSWGRPVDVDTKVYKQKTNETWKYGQTGKNRFNQRVFTENGVVVGWQQH